MDVKLWIVEFVFMFARFEEALIDNIVGKVNELNLKNLDFIDNEVEVSTKLTE